MFVLRSTQNVVRTSQLENLSVYIEFDVRKKEKKDDRPGGTQLSTFDESPSPMKRPPDLRFPRSQDDRYQSIKACFICRDSVSPVGEAGDG